jgi:hypothetical protein
VIGRLFDPAAWRLRFATLHPCEEDAAGSALGHKVSILIGMAEYRLAA